MTCHHNMFNSWKEYDRRGREIGRVCRTCLVDVLRRQDPTFLSDKQKLALKIATPEKQECIGCGEMTSEADKICTSCKAIMAEGVMADVAMA